MEKGQHPEVLSPAASELAASLQAVLRDCEFRDFSLDIAQQQAIESVGRALMDGETTGYIEMATSTGKTAIEALITEAAVRVGKRVLILAPKIAIARQISGNDPEKPTGLARFTNVSQASSVGHHYGHEHASTSDQVVISTYAGFLNDAKHEHLQLGTFDVVIGDECHRSLGQETSKAMQRSFPNAVKFGFSATPDFAVDRTSEEVFGNKLFEFSLIDAVESGKTAPIRTLIYETGEKLKLHDNRDEFTERELAPFIENIERNGTARQLALDFVRDGRQGIISCIPGFNNVHARLLSDVLNRSGITATDVGAHLSAEDQACRLKKFQNGEIDVLTFTRALEEGWDSDVASFCINMAPTASPVRTKQLMGRILRPNPDGRESIYIDFIDETSGIAKQQYTALHALDIETIDFDRVLGRHEGSNSSSLASPLKRPIIHASLYERLLQSNGKCVSDLSTSHQGIYVDPVKKHWESILEKEGMPAELPYNTTFEPAFAKQFEKAYQKFITTHQVEPTADDMIEMLPTIPKIRKKHLGEYGIRVTMEKNLGQIPDHRETGHPDLLSEENILRKQLNEVLDTLSEREAGVIVMRFGLDDSEPKSYEQIGKAYGVTSVRIKQIESKTISKLRHPSRSKALKGYIIDEDEHSPEAIAEVSDWKKTLQSAMWNEESGTYRSFSPSYTTQKEFYIHDEDQNREVIFRPAVSNAAKAIELSEYNLSDKALTLRLQELDSWRHRILVKIEKYEKLPVRIESFEQRAATLTMLDSRLALIDSLIPRVRALQTAWRKTH